jgi:hypothetical protein
MRPPIEAAFLTRYRRGLGAWLGWRIAMVSTDHFRHELLAQLGRATTQGHIDVTDNLNAGVAVMKSAQDGA